MGKICTLKQAWTEINKTLNEAVKLLAEMPVFQISEDGKTLYVINASNVFEEQPEIIPILWIYGLFHGTTFRTEFEKEIKFARGKDGTLIADWGIDD